MSNKGEDRTGPDGKSEADDPGRINGLQIAAATGAATTAAVVADALGIYGTVVGVAVFSVVSSVGTVVYLKSMRHTKKRIEMARNRTGAVPNRAPVRAKEFLRRNWRAIVVSSLIVFGLTVGVLTALALVSGKPATSYYGVNPPQSTTQEPAPSDEPEQPGPTGEESESSQQSSEAETPSQQPSTSPTPSPQPESGSGDASDGGNDDGDGDLKGTPPPGNTDAS